MPWLPRVRLAFRWATITALALLAIIATLFWALVLGRFAGSGFHAGKGTAAAPIAITPECAWPYSVNDHDAEAVCRLFYNMTPEQRAQVLKARK